MPLTREQLAAIYAKLRQKKPTQIGFPKGEHKDLAARYASGKPIVTTRVSDELGKYQVGGIYRSPFGPVQVMQKTQYQDIKKHPFLARLTKDQKRVLAKYGKFEVVTLLPVEQRR